MGLWFLTGVELRESPAQTNDSKSWFALVELSLSFQRLFQGHIASPLNVKPSLQIHAQHLDKLQPVSENRELNEIEN